MTFLLLFRSQRGRGAPGVLAGEADERDGDEERRPGHLRVGPLRRRPLRLLRHPAGGVLLRKLRGETEKNNRN